ncbi:hypothetical protein D3C76_1146760 [compost metagenome]
MAHRDGEVQAVGIVIDVAEQGVARILGVIVVQARVDADQVIVHVGVIQVVVVLVPDVLQFCGVEAAGQAGHRAPGGPRPGQVLAVTIIRQCAVRGADALVATLVVGLGEAGLAPFDQ